MVRQGPNLSVHLRDVSISAGGGGGGGGRLQNQNTVCIRPRQTEQKGLIPEGINLKGWHQKHDIDCFVFFFATFFHDQ